jgi:lysophospholipase L1-like esterase
LRNATFLGDNLHDSQSEVSLITRHLALIVAFSTCAGAASAPKISISPSSNDQQSGLHALPMRTVGRALSRSASDALQYVRQWPGTYFETAFKGRDFYFKVGSGDAILKVTVDGGEVQRLTKPTPGLYRLDGLRKGKHQVRVDVVTESQAGPTEFDGFYGDSHVKALSTKVPARQIEFIGDSHTVGYGNTSPKRECTEDEVWSTTDTSQSFAPLVAQRFDADYEVNAISGRGVVRNYDGFAGDSLPLAYPFALLDHTVPYKDVSWHPLVIVMSLGTNDFSTPLHDGEKWKTREELHADYEKTYVEFLHQLRAANPGAYFVLWATDMSDGEISSEVQRVVEQARAAGEHKITFVAVKNLEFSACNYHPSLNDERKIADAVTAAIASGAFGR